MITHPFEGGGSRLRSLNRARIVALPALVVDEGIPGRTGYELLSASAINDHRSRLAANPTVPTGKVEQQLATLAGRRLGYLLTMLARGDAANRAARPIWGDDQWAFWRGVRRVGLGGGLVAALDADALVAGATAVLEAAGVDVAIEVAGEPERLPLLGLARAVSGARRVVVVLDCGHTSIKRAIARRARDGEVRLAPLPTIPSPCTQVSGPLATWSSMRRATEDTWQHLAPPERADAAVGLSIACHLQDGHPYPDDSDCYAALRELDPHLETFIATELAARLDPAPPLTLLPDGAAAAHGLETGEDAIAITLGTAVGWGWMPTANHGSNP